jgi:hypothetical protein
MANKMTTLKDALARVSGRADAPQAAPVSSTLPVPPSRQGKKGIVVYVLPEASQELRLLSINTGRSQQDLCVEAINDLLTKYRRMPIA